jgi:hypothetical protein
MEEGLEGGKEERWRGGPVGAKILAERGFFWEVPGLMREGSAWSRRGEGGGGKKEESGRGGVIYECA